MFALCQRRRELKNILAMIYDISTFKISSVPIPRYWHIALKRLFFFFRGLNHVGLIAWERVFYQMPGVFGSYFETIKPFIYMRSRSLTAGSADQHAYTQNLLEVCAVMCVRHISSCIVDRRWYSIIIARRRDSASASREKGKKVSAINAHAYCIHARLDANQECVCTHIYMFVHSLDSHSSSKGKSAAVDTRCEW